MTLQQLEYALALKKYGSYGRAAKSVGISQPAMSLQIQKLEAETALKLFDRSKKPVAPTAAGEEFLAKAQLLITQAEQLKSFAETLSEEVSGQLDVGIIPTLAPYLIPLFIEDLNNRFPGLKLHIREMLTIEIIEGIKNGQLHGGIISTPIQSTTRFDTLPLFYEGFKLFVSEKHALYSKDSISIEQIENDDLWLLTEGNCFRNQVSNICKLPPKSDHKNLFFYESTSIESLCRIVEYKGGITFLPELTTLHFSTEREEMIKEITGPRQVREISMICLPNQVRKEILYKVSDVIQENIPKSLLKKGEAKAVDAGIQVA